MPKVSVIIPCHNTADFLPTCLNSVCNQTLKDIEVLAIDDHSTDHTKDILKQYQKKYPKKLKIYSLEEKTGASAARNLGLENADGEFIGFVDSDDVISLNMYEDYYTAAKKEKMCLVTGTFKNIKEHQFLHQETFLNRTQKEGKRIDFLQDPENFFAEAPACWNKLFSHDLINIKFLEGKIFEDASFTYPLLLKAKQAFDIKRVHYYYRRRTGSVTRNNKTPTIKIFDMLDVTIYMKKLGHNLNFDSQQMTLLEDIIKERLLTTLEYVKIWPIDEKAKYQVMKKLIKIYQYNFPNFQQFNTQTARFLYNDMLVSFKEFPYESLHQKEYEECYENTLKLVKSLSTSRDF